MTNDPNPYAAPTQVAAGGSEEYQSIPAGDLKKIQAIIKDANQFWLAILLCFLCSAIGMVLIGPWYLVRLLQWSSMANAYPHLRNGQAPPGSLAQRFQSAQWKLIVGLAVGLLIGMVVVAFLILPSLLLGVSS